MDSTMKDQARNNPSEFERDHPDEALAAFEKAMAHYRSLASWGRADLERMAGENWPLFVC